MTLGANMRRALTALAMFTGAVAFAAAAGAWLSLVLTALFWAPS